MRTDWDPRAARERRGSIATAFRIPTTGTFATTQEKNPLRQPGFWDINLSFRKGFRTFGTQRFDLRIEAFNIINRTRLGNAVTNPTLPDFGFITSTTSATARCRSACSTSSDRAQLALKFRSTPPPPDPGGGSSRLN